MYQFTTLAIESWTLYAISISLIFSRLIFRRITLGHFNKFQADDWLAVVLLVPYTASIVLANQVGHAESATERKYRYVLEEMQLITIWLVKACILVLYWRIFPIGTSLAKRRALQGVALFCATSFIIIQTSLMLWCQPTEQYWSPTNTNTQCKTYHSHTALSTAFTIPGIILVMLVPVPFIQTPRRILLAILFALGTLVLVFGIVSNAMILTAPQSPRYLYWMTAESSIAIIFANLPFLTSFVVTAAPARLRHLSSHLTLSQWPRSRRGSWEFSDVESTTPPYRSARLNSSATAVNEEPSALDSINAKTSPVWSPTTQDMPIQNIGSPGHSRVSSQDSQRAQSPLIPDPVVARRPDTRDSEVPRMRQSGGLAEMGELSAQDTQGWPIYWR